MRDKRAFIIGLAIVAVLLAVLVVAPGYVSMQPSFLERYARMDVKYKSWTQSVHAKVACQSCHVKPDRLSQMAFQGRMLGEFYLSIVSPGREPSLFAQPTNEACASCHMDLRTVSPAGDLNIPHRAHVSVLKLKCIECHRYLVHDVSPEGKHTPPMTACLRCHDGKTAKNACSACHTNKVEPLTHRAPDWLEVHGSRATSDCNRCHAWTQHWCSECHSRRPRSHATGWRTAHGAAVKKERDCEACHAASFCVRCHGELPQTNFDPALKLVR
jgi:hypothetical protein